MFVPQLFNDRMLADPVFIIVDHNDVVRGAEQHGYGDASLYHNAMGHVNDNQVVIYWHLIIYF